MGKKYFLRNVAYGKVPTTHSGKYMYQELCFLSKKCIYMFHMIFTINIDYFINGINQLVSLWERQWEQNYFLQCDAM
jgi:hypothetical protein